VSLEEAGHGIGRLLEHEWLRLFHCKVRLVGRGDDAGAVFLAIGRLGNTLCAAASIGDLGADLRVLAYNDTFAGLLLDLYIGYQQVGDIL